MALEYICTEMIIRGMRIAIPAGANFLRTGSGEVKFYNANGGNGKGMSIPAGTREIVFENFVRHLYHIDYGKPIFYNGQGDVLKNL